MSLFGLVDKFNNALVNSNLSEINVNGVISTVKENIIERVDVKSQLLTIKSLNKDFNSLVASNLLVPLLDLLNSIENSQLELLLDTLLCIFELSTKSTKLILSNGKIGLLLGILTSNSSSYAKLYTIQILNILLINFKSLTINQLISHNGLSNLIQLLDYSNFIRSETIIILLYITDFNSELQKIAAFEGIFDKLFNIILTEGAIDGGILVQDCLHCIQNLLRYNSSNISFFREMGFVKNLSYSLSYSPENLDSFCLQYWSEQKVINAAIVIDIVRIIAGLGNRQGNLVRILLFFSLEKPPHTQQAILQSGLTQCLIDLSLSSNAPITLKAQTLTALTSIFSTSPQNQHLFTHSQTQPILNSEAYAAGYLKLPPRLATISLIDIALNGESGDENRMVDDVDSLKGHNLMLQVAALTAFESLITSNDTLKLEIIASMSHSHHTLNYDGSLTHTAGSLLLEALSTLPDGEGESAGGASDGALISQKVFFASLIMTHILRYSEDAKAMARNVPFTESGETSESGDEESISLLHGIFGNLTVCARERAAADARARAAEFSSINRGEGGEDEREGELGEKAMKNRDEKEEEEHDSVDSGNNNNTHTDWTRLTTSYLILLSVWVWESPRTVSDILRESSNLQLLIQPIKHSGVDALIQGLCAFTLAAIYRYNTEAHAEVTKTDLHALIHKQVGVDNVIQSLARFRADRRFGRVSSPDDSLMLAENPHDEGWWFDWHYVEFFKGSFMAVQRSVVREDVEDVEDMGENKEVLPSSHPPARIDAHVDADTDADASAEYKKALEEKDALVESLRQRIEEVKVQYANCEMEAERVNSELGDARSKLQVLWEQGSPESAALRTDLAERVEREEVARREVERLTKEIENIKENEAGNRAEYEASLKAEYDYKLKTSTDTLNDTLTAKISQADELERQLSEAKAQNESLKHTHTSEIHALTNNNTTLNNENNTLKSQAADNENSQKELEDLLVLLEDITSKRAMDKTKMRHAGWDVSDDEEDE
ncbi:hypothetical protein E3P92_00861 [Wallemia ichthyophaga]|nr:hypothetical protein E3P92_00861 [Wallemia ichthyophaga]